MIGGGEGFRRACGGSIVVWYNKEGHDSLSEGLGQGELAKEQL